jgi:YD repeat-containing protein
MGCGFTKKYCVQAPGTFNFSTLYSFGLVTQYDNDQGGDGTVNALTTYTYDANGNRTQEKYDWGPDGNWDRLTNYTYDANGNQTKVEVDAGGDGTVNIIRTSTYDAKGNRIKYEEDRNADGKMEAIYTYTYDTTGNLFKAEFDYQADGAVDRIDTYTYDDNGNLIKLEEDTNADGEIDIIFNYTYDEIGNHVKTEEDVNADGVVDKTDKFTYDANGKLIKHEEDLWGNADPERFRQYTYDANGNLIKLEFGGTLGAPVIWYYTYDASGNLIKEEMDIEANGVITTLTTNTYDANGNLIKKVRDEGADGSAEQIDTYTYENRIICDQYAGLAHKLKVEIPTSGRWVFKMCGTTFESVMVLSEEDFCEVDLFYAIDGCDNGYDPQAWADLDSGTYYLTIAGKYANDKGDYHLEIYRESGLGTAELSKQMVSVYPNPTSNILHLDRVPKDVKSVQVINVLGEIVLSTSTTTHIEVGDLPSGSYILLLQDRQGVTMGKQPFLKQ